MSANTFKLKVSKVDRLLFAGEAISINLPGTEGEFTVLSNHEPLISMLKQGTIRIETQEKHREFDVKSGICEVHNNSVTILI